jgi:hypothetical protein
MHDHQNLMLCADGCESEENCMKLDGAKKA